MRKLTGRAAMRGKNLTTIAKEQKFHTTNMDYMTTENFALVLLIVKLTSILKNAMNAKPMEK